MPQPAIDPRIRAVMDAIHFRIEVSRKLLHVSSIAIPALYWFISRELALWVLLGGLLIAVAVELLRYHHAGFRAWFRYWFGFMVRPAEWRRITGATYVLLGALLTVWLFPKPIAISALLVAHLADAVASLAGQRFGRKRFLGKTLEGSLAFFLTAFAVIWLTTRGPAGISFTAALLAAVVEACPTPKFGRFELNDNLTVPLLTGAAVWALQALAQVS